MSRFTPARRAAISIWTGASVIWATTALAVGLEKGEQSPPAKTEVSAKAFEPVDVIPRPPASGLVIIRSQLRPEDSGPATTDASVAPTDPVPAPAPPPRPVSSGS